jgi:hypothetical protein
MSSNNHNRRWAGGVGKAACAAIAAALFGLPPAARADGPDPFEHLFGDTRINDWTPAADASLLNSDPTLAANLDASVDSFLLNVGQTDPLSFVAYEFDPSAFSMDPEGFGYFSDGGVPLNATGDLAIGLDYMFFATGIGEVPPGIWFPDIWDLAHLYEVIFGIGAF